MKKMAQGSPATLLVKSVVEGYSTPHYYRTFFNTQTSPTRPNRPTTVTAAAVKAPLIAPAKDKVAITSTTTRAKVMLTIGLARGDASTIYFHLLFNDIYVFMDKTYIKLY